MKYLQLVRERKNLSPEDVAKLAKIGLETYLGIESGGVRPTGPEKSAIACALGVPRKNLFVRVDESLLS
jgi:transcriptional regulator with XRE-family HTH domain